MEIKRDETGLAEVQPGSSAVTAPSGVRNPCERDTHLVPARGGRSRHSPRQIARRAGSRPLPVMQEWIFLTDHLGASCGSILSIQLRPMAPAPPPRARPPTPEERDPRRAPRSRSRRSR
jgi:hypothetical protein